MPPLKLVPFGSDDSVKPCSLTTGRVLWVSSLTLHVRSTKNVFQLYVLKTAWCVLQPSILMCQLESYRVPQTSHIPRRYSSTMFLHKYCDLQRKNHRFRIFNIPCHLREGDPSNLESLSLSREEEEILPWRSHTAFKGDWQQHSYTAELICPDVTCPE